MKKIIPFLPLIITAIIIAILLGLYASGKLDAPKESTITSSTLTETVSAANLATAKYIHHGIAKAQIEGKESGYVLYYATVKPSIDLSEIQYEIDHNEKSVSVIIPKEFSFDVELLEDENHKFYYYPENKDDWTGKDVYYICETDAKQKVANNTEFIARAKESLVNTITVLLNPVLSNSDYTLSVN